MLAEGCPGDCGVHGQCRQEVTDDAGEVWSCVCSYGWKGANCNIEVETQCDDGIDNDLGMCMQVLAGSVVA